MAIGSTGGSDSLKVTLEATDNASKVIGALADTVEKLDGSKTKVSVGVDDKASKPLGEVSDTVKKLDGTEAEVGVKLDDGNVGRDIDDILEKVDKIGGEAANLILTSNASEITREIADLVTEVQQLDSQSVEFQVKADRIQSLEGDLDKLSSKAKELNGTDISLNTSGARQGIDDLGRSADSSKSVLANMVGNTTQDLGALGGVAGSAGVAIGQMGEYMADAAGSGDKLGQILGSFGKIAVPLAGIGVITKVVSDEFQRNAEAAAANEESINGLFEALQKGQSILSVFSETIKETGKFEFDVGDIVPDLQAVNLSVAEFTKLAEGTPEQLASWTAAQRTLVTEGTPAYEAMRNVVFALVQANAQAAEATDRHAATVQILGEHITTEREAILGATLAQKARVDALKEAAAAEEKADNTQRYIDQAAGLQAAAKAAGEYRDVVSSSDFGAASLQGAAEGAQAFFEQTFALPNIAANVEEAFDSMGAAVEKNGATFDTASEAGRENLGQLQQLASATVPQIAAAFDSAGGSVEQFATNMAGVRESVIQGLTSTGQVSREQAEQIADALGLIPDNVQTQYELLGTESATAKLQLLSDVIGGLPPTVKAEVVAEISAGDPQAAVDTITAYFAGNPPTATAQVGANTAPAQVELDGWAAAANSTTATSTLEADSAPANADLDGWVAAAGAATGTANLGADDTSARGTVTDFINTPWGTTIYGKGDMSDADSKARNLGPYSPDVIGDYVRTDGVPQRLTIPVILQAVNNFFRRGGTAPREGISIAGENYRPEILDDKYLISSPTVIRPGTKVTGEAETARILAGAGVSAKGGTMMRLHPETISAIAAAASRRPMVVEIDGRVVASKELRRSAQSVRAATTRMAVAKAMARR